MSTFSSVGCGHVCGPAPLHWKLFCAAGKLEEGLKIKITLQPPFDNQSNQGGVSVSGCWIVEIIMIRGHLTIKTTHTVEVLKDVLSVCLLVGSGLILFCSHPLSGLSQQLTGEQEEEELS